MTNEEFEKLNIGDIVKHDGLSSLNDNYVVTANYGTRVVAVRTVDLTNPNEWNVVVKATHEVRGSCTYHNLKQL
jgi:hypothetical protein